MQKSKTGNFKRFNASGYRVGIVVAQFNKDVTEKMLKSALQSLFACKVPRRNIRVCRVAGSIEIPVVLQSLAMTKKFDCLVAIGTIIKGDTPHFDYVAKIVSEGVLRVMLAYNIPVGFGVLTLNSHDQALSRIKVGGSSVEAALQNARLLKNIK